MTNSNLPSSTSMFWMPQHSDTASAWFEHAPFAFWLIDTLRPTNMVELGCHAGFSYFCFCQAVAKLKTKTKCHAVDTWSGDEHAGFYDERIYTSVVELNQPYNSFSSLLRTTFDDALSNFPDKSIDFLHIDGRHFYEDVKHDYENWLPKLSNNAIVLFHDTNVREREFGVWKLFKALKRRHAGFEFLHGNGLGVLAPGKVPKAMKPFFAENPALLRQVFSALGLAIADRHRLRVAEGELSSADENSRQVISKLQIENQRLGEEQKFLQELVARVAEQQNSEPLLLKPDAPSHTPVIDSDTFEAIAKIIRKLNVQRPLTKRLRHLVQSVFNPTAARLHDIRNSVFFDGDWYLRTYPDVAEAGVDPAQHYWSSGAAEGRDPGPYFSTRAYETRHPEVLQDEQNPLLHQLINSGDKVYH